MWSNYISETVSSLSPLSNAESLQNMFQEIDEEKAANRSLVGHCMGFENIEQWLHRRAEGIGISDPESLAALNLPEQVRSAIQQLWS